MGTSGDNSRLCWGRRYAASTMRSKAKKPSRAARPSKRLRLTAAVTPEDDLYVAQCLEVDVASQGETVEQALTNLQEALELYFEDSTALPASAAPIIAPVEVTVPGAY